MSLTVGQLIEKLSGVDPTLRVGLGVVDCLASSGAPVPTQGLANTVAIVPDTKGGQVLVITNQVTEGDTTHAEGPAPEAGQVS